MRVCYINRLLNEPWGCGVHAQALVRSWGEAAHEVLCLPDELAVPGGEETRHAGRFAWLPAPVHNAALDVRGRIWQLRRKGRLTTSLREFDPEVLICRRALYDYGVDASLRAMGLPYVAEVNAILADEELALRGSRVLPWERERERQYLRRGAACICVTDEVRSSLVALGVRPERIAVIPNGVDTRLFRPNATPNTTTADWAKRYRLVLAYSGTLPDTHDTSMLLRAAVRIRDRVPDVGFLFVGPTSDELSRHPGWHSDLHAHVRCTGRIPHGSVASHLCSATICWAAFRSDYLSPLKLYEYLAMAKPVIIAGSGQSVADIRASGGGIAVPRGDLAALAEAAFRYGTSPREDLSAIGTRGRAWVQTHRSWPGVAAAYVSFAAGEDSRAPTGANTQAVDALDM